MTDPTRTPELDELVALLRSATPSASTIAEARSGVLDVAGPSGGGSAGGAAGIAARFGYLVLVLLSVAAPPMHDALAHPDHAKPDRPHGGQGRGTSSDASTHEVPHPGPPPRAAEGERASTVILASSTPARGRGPGGGSTARTTASITTHASDAPRAPIVDEPAKQDGPVVTAVPPSAPPPIDAAPSPAMAEALRDYSAERYAEAAVGFSRVVEGTSDDAPQRVAQADFFLAKCLYHLELYHASAAAFDEVTTRGATHPYFGASLRWLAMLAEHLPEPSGVIESIGRYDEAQLAELDTEATRDHYLHLSYLLGRARYRERRFAEAIRLFSRVPDGTRWALEARFFEGISHVREHRSRPALAAFRRVIRAVESGRTGGHEDPNRMYDLAWMSVARLYYSLAMQLPRSRDAHASELLSHAIAAWRRIPLRSEHWLDSFYEETWALYVAHHHGRALGHVHALESPYFRDRANPEALVVRAMIFFEHCQWDATESALASFHRRFDPVYDDAQRAERMAATNEDSYRMLVAVQAGRSRVPPRVLPALRASFADRDLMRHLAQVRSIEREQRRLERAAGPVLDASLIARVSGDLAVVHALAIDRTGELARARISRLAGDLAERMTQMDTIEVELATVRREELARPNRLPMGPADGGRIVAVQGDQIWPWDGEWWRDELPFYVQEVQNRCSH